jgi:hypothetical protein
VKINVSATGGAEGMKFLLGGFATDRAGSLRLEADEFPHHTASGAFIIQVWNTG